MTPILNPDERKRCSVYLWSSEPIENYRVDLQFGGLRYDQQSVKHSIYGEPPRMWDWDTGQPKLRFWSKKPLPVGEVAYIGSFGTYIKDGSASQWMGIVLAHMEAGRLECHWHRPFGHHAIDFATPVNPADWAGRALFWMYVE